MTARKKTKATLNRHEIDPFDYLVGRLANEIKAGNHEKAQPLALELLPYTKPRLKMVDKTSKQQTEVIFKIGGKEWA